MHFWAQKCVSLSGITHMKTFNCEYVTGQCGMFSLDIRTTKRLELKEHRALIPGFQTRHISNSESESFLKITLF